MRAALDVYIFRETGFAPSGDTVACVADRGSEPSRTIASSQIDSSD
jgi:hypothetical protein